MVAFDLLYWAKMTEILQMNLRAVHQYADIMRESISNPNSIVLLPVESRLGPISS